MLLVTKQFSPRGKMMTAGREKRLRHWQLRQEGGSDEDLIDFCLSSSTTPKGPWVSII